MICETLARRHVASWRRARLHRTIRITKKGGSTRMTDASGTGVRTGRHAEQRIRCTRDREGVRLQTRRRFENKKYYMRAHIREPDAKPHMPARGAKANTHTMTCTQFRDTRRYAHHTLHRTGHPGERCVRTNMRCQRSTHAMLWFVEQLIITHLPSVSVKAREKAPSARVGRARCGAAHHG